MIEFYIVLIIRINKYFLSIIFYYVIYWFETVKLGIYKFITHFKYFILIIKYSNFMQYLFNLYHIFILIFCFEFHCLCSFFNLLHSFNSFFFSFCINYVIYKLRIFYWAISINIDFIKQTANLFFGNCNSCFSKKLFEFC